NAVGSSYTPASTARPASVNASHSQAQARSFWKANSGVSWRRGRSATSSPRAPTTRRLTRSFSSTAMRQIIGEGGCQATLRYWRSARRSASSRVLGAEQQGRPVLHQLADDPPQGAAATGESTAT